MTVTALLVSHDGARWLPAVLTGLIGQTLPVDRVVAVDTTSRDDSVTLVRDALGEHVRARRRARLDELSRRGAPRPRAGPRDRRRRVDLAAPRRQQPRARRPSPSCSPPPRSTPTVAILGPKLREWPSLRRLLEVGLTITGTGHRETGLERGEYDQGQHDAVREVLAVNTAGMLVRRSRAGVARRARRGPADLRQRHRLRLARRAGRAPHARRAAGRGLPRRGRAPRHPAYAAHRAAHALPGAARRPPHLAGQRLLARRFAWQYVRLFLGSLLRVVGFLAVRSVGEALDELAAALSVHGRPRQVLAARRERADRRRASPPTYAACWPRRGCPTATDSTSSPTSPRPRTSQAADVAERRRLAKAEDAPGTGPGVREARRGSGTSEDDDEDAYLTDTGIVARFFTNPVAVVLVLFGVLLAARRAARRSARSPAARCPRCRPPRPTGGACTSPAGTRSAPAPTCRPLPTCCRSRSPRRSCSATPEPSCPASCCSPSRWRRGARGGCSRSSADLVDPLGLPRWLVVWGALTYALVPVTSGAWAEGRFGTVAVAALLPWTAHAALGFVDPDRDRRWRAAWRTALLLALGAAFVPGLLALRAAGHRRRPRLRCGHRPAAAARARQLGSAGGRRGRDAACSSRRGCCRCSPPAPRPACCSRPAASPSTR